VGNQWKIVPQPYVNATGLIDQSIDGRKTFLSDSTFEENIIQANDKYFYIQGTDGDIEGPNAIRFTVKADGSYELDQKDDVGTDWVGIESVLSTGEKVIKVKNSFIEGLITSNSKPIVFRNSSGESEEEGALRLFNGSDNVWRIQRFNAVNETETRLTIGETQLVIYDKDTIPVAIFDDPSASATEELTVITRKKGDARYSKVENFQLDTTSNYNLPSGWSVSRSNSGSFQSLVVTHNIGSRLYPVVSKGSSASTANPYILTSETNSFTVVSSNAFGTSTNILVKI
jgi:hypothetical protein